MTTIDSVGHRRVPNSHVAFTTEYVVWLDDGSLGLGATPEGETISIYEDRRATDADMVVKRLRRDGLVDRQLTQEVRDDYLSQTMTTFVRNTCFALSLAFFNTEAKAGRHYLPGGSALPSRAPKICCNVLNGGWHELSPVVWCKSRREAPGAVT